ncbi:DUF1003 domain-containing protein [bacterium]|nr:MAG: DUF1003 domain-containing protein [bacterium]
MNKKEILTCCICKKTLAENFVIPGYGIQTEIEKLILEENQEWNDKCYICKDDFNRLRKKYILNLVTEERGNIEKLEQEVINSIHESDLLSTNPNLAYREITNPGDRIADKVAKFGGSWNFIIIFFVILVIWILINTYVLLFSSFDPYPFILLNLILSCMAAVQAPIIIMSQNRQETKDRIRSENDYKVNLKAEIEIRTLHEKIDHLLLEQWSKLMKTQEIQMDMLEDISKETKK